MSTKTAEIIEAVKNLLDELKREHDRMVESQKNLARKLEKAKKEKEKES